jgi:hypothetical protein
MAISKGIQEGCRDAGVDIPAIRGIVVSANPYKLGQGQAFDPNKNDPREWGDVADVEGTEL